MSDKVSLENERTRFQDAYDILIKILPEIYSCRKIICASFSRLQLFKDSDEISLVIDVLKYDFDAYFCFTRREKNTIIQNCPELIAKSSDAFKLSRTLQDISQIWLIRFNKLTPVIVDVAAHAKMPICEEISAVVKIRDLVEKILTCVENINKYVIKGCKKIEVNLVSNLEEADKIFKEITVSECTKLIEQLPQLLIEVTAYFYDLHKNEKINKDGDFCHKNS